MGSPWYPWFLHWTSLTALQEWKHNLADYPTKHHSGTHHAAVRPIYLYDKHKTPTTVKGCVEILDRTFSTKQHVHAKAVRAQRLPNLTIPAGTTRPVQRVQQHACQTNRLSDTNTRTILGRKPITSYTRKLLATKYSHLRRVLQRTIPTLINS